MFSQSRKRVVAGIAVGLALTLGVAACGGDDDDDASGTDDTTETTETMVGETTPPDSAAAASDGPFGEGCAGVPTDGEGSVDGMADDPVATAASNNPLLTQLVGAVGAANLVDTLNTTENLTVFAPADSAFAAMDKATVDAAMADPTGLLTTVLTYHVLPERLAPEDLAGEHETLQGESLTVEGSGEAFTVNDANVVCGNVQTANATVYVIDGVLTPPSAV